VLGSDSPTPIKKRIDFRSILLFFILLNSDLSDLSGYTQIGSTGVYYRKYLNIVELHIAKNIGTITNMGLELATLPQEIRPAYPINFLVPVTTDPSLPSVFGEINSSTGLVKVVAWSTITIDFEVNINLVYLVK